MSEPSAPAAEAAIALLRARGERVTKARRALLEVLAGDHDHLSADDIADRLGAAESGAHRATVYRTLDALVRLGIVAHVHLPHGAATYHLLDAERAHLHLLCRACGAITDAPPDLLDDVGTAVERSVGFRIDPEHVALTGWCRPCQLAAASGSGGGDVGR